MGATFIGVGRLGKNPVMKYTPKGTAQTYFSIAIESGFGDKKNTIWANVVCWGQQAELMNQWLTKGSRVEVVAEITDISTFTKKDETVGTSLNLRLMQANFIDGIAKKEESENWPNDEPEPEEF